MATKYYLDQAGLERLVEYLNAALNAKMDKGDVEIPSDVVRMSTLENYVTKDEAITTLPNDLVYTDDLNSYALASSLSDYATTDDLARVENKTTGVYHYMGSVADLAALQEIQNPAQGDVYNLEDTGINAAWTGSQWDEFGTIVDLSPYALSADIQPIDHNTLNSILYSGTTAVVADIEGIQAMINNNQSEVIINLSKNINNMSTLEIPTDKRVVLDLGGNTIVATETAFNIIGGELVIQNGNLTSSANDVIVATDGANVIINDGNITSVGHNGISATESTVVMNSGSITSQEAGIAGFKDSTIIINGGIITGIDNGGIMGNGSGEGSPRDGRNINIIMNGGIVIGHIQSAGYVACGVYMPNTGSFIMNGGEIISDGAGIVMRGGLVHIGADAKIYGSGETGIVGKVGDSKINVGSYGIVYDATSNYPGVDSLELIIDAGAIVEGTDGDIDIILSDGQTANITDNRIHPEEEP